MDAGLLRTWLGLPPGPWPPGDREILGLADGPADPATVELRALAQMDRLRPHQLRYPELVTEGMNRLAQAMIALTAGGDTGTAPPKPRKHVKKKPKRVEVLPDNLALPDSGVVVPVVEATAHMLRHEIRHLLLRNWRGEVTGVVSLRDVLGVLLDATDPAVWILIRQTLSVSIHGESGHRP